MRDEIKPMKTKKLTVRWDDPPLATSPWTTAKPAKPGNYVLRPRGRNDSLQLVRVAKSHGGFRIYFRTEDDGTLRYQSMSSLPKNFWEWLEIPG